MPLIGALGAASAKGLGFGGTSVDPFFLASGNGAETAEFDSLTMDSYDSTTFVRNFDYGNYACRLTKRSKSSVATWGYTISQGGAESGNQVVTPKIGLSSNGQHLWWSAKHAQNTSVKLLMKINPTTGASILSRGINTNQNDTINSIYVDTSGDAYIVTNSSGTYSFIVKISGSDGSIVWQKRADFGAGSRQLIAYGITVSGSNVYVSYHIQNNQYNFVAILSTSNGSTVGRYRYSMGTHTGDANARAITDSSGNIYFLNVGYYSSNFAAAYVTKYVTSNNTVAWQKYFFNSPNETTPSARVGGLALNAANDKLYLVCGTWQDSNPKAQWAELLTSDGSVQRGLSLAVQGQSETYYTGVGVTATHLYAHGFRSYYPSVVGVYVAVPINGTRQYTTAPYTYNTAYAMQSSSNTPTATSDTGLTIDSTSSVSSSSVDWSYTNSGGNNYSITPI